MFETIELALDCADDLSSRYTEMRQCLDRNISAEQRNGSRIKGSLFLNILSASLSSVPTAIVQIEAPDERLRIITTQYEARDAAEIDHIFSVVGSAIRSRSANLSFLEKNRLESPR